MEWAGLLVLLAIVVMVFSFKPDIPGEKPKRFSKEQYAYYLENRRPAPSGLAKGTPGLVQCGVGKPTVPMYMRTPELRARAQELVTAVAVGKKAIAAHMDAKKQGVLTDDSAMRITIAGVVRDRKTLKKLQYDQPF
jgi:hypothetical protein